MNIVGRFWRSQIGKKIVMAVTGLIGVAFVLGHMIGNLQVFEGAEKINAYGRFLHHTVGTELWLVRAGLLAAVVLHVVAATQLTAQARASRPQAYHRREPQVSTLASRTMRVGGFLLLAFIILHILHFTVRAFPGYDQTDPLGGVDVYRNLLLAFRNPLWTLFYVVSMVFLGLHLYHGFWSSFRTLGAAKPSRVPLHRTAALVVALIVWAGFTIVPLAVFFGAVRDTAPGGAMTVLAPAAQAPADAPTSAAPAAPR
ncbi:succinate dehydrogenase (or fumarate reductase) cytochrome b subunit, b558 family [Gemmatirosa kalamazoonensis]|uniref:Succinate dehydrogenase (Or fumarate reductase) cytochrome b subunit, b558 family n=1 Tax=Gemmatirosa kalamazoonensis TaxID=861299 RepID=W0RK76_9BACT|nr:succinate dehydrogenase cytochrome b subunit [Gemmatirosa kalamazoonensis]AHG90837.1 succinate dehydrogenase (or fumarate reductase) cytochrome b subunit, b558 family [Gemmatirosa kalamazoonensis]